MSTFSASSGVTPYAPPILKLLATEYRASTRAEAITQALEFQNSLIHGLYIADQSNRERLAEAKARRATLIDQYASIGASPPDAELAPIDAELERRSQSTEQGAVPLAEATRKKGIIQTVRSNKVVAHLNELVSQGVTRLEMADIDDPDDPSSWLADEGRAKRAANASETDKALGAVLPMEKVIQELEAKVAQVPPFQVHVPEGSMRFHERTGRPTRLRDQPHITPAIVAVHAEPRSDSTMPNAPDAWAMLCWANPKLVKDEIRRQVQEAYEGMPDAVIMTNDERNKALHRLRAERLELERIEAECIWALREAGDTDVFFRKDIDPRAVLGIA